jgi:PPOX class probable F420-dependent enzyme
VSPGSAGAGSGAGVRARFAAAPVARLATVRPDGSPHLVPVTFALSPGGDEVVFAVDSKPKTTTHLQRLANIAAEPRVSFLVDHYDDDWTQLWWVRVDGVARLLDEAAEAEARTSSLDALAAKYPQYRDVPPAGAVVVTRITRWSDWSYR